MKNKLMNHILNWLPKDFIFEYENVDSGIVYVRNSKTDERFALTVEKVDE